MSAISKAIPDDIDPNLNPFYPGTTYQYAWDSTSLGQLKECPQKYYLSMVRGLRGGAASIHLEFGILYHKALENYDKLRAHGVTHTTAEEIVVKELLVVTYGWEFDHNLKTRETLIRTVVWYLEQFGDNDPATTVVLNSGVPAVELSFRLQVDDELVLCGHLDRVVEFQGQNYVMDRKTSNSTISSYYFDQFSPDNQMSLYTLAGSIIYDNPVKGVIIDAAQIAVGFSRFERAMVYRTDTQTTEWLRDTKLFIEQSRRYSDLNYWPRNDKSCHKYGGCPFRQICASDPRVRETFISSNFSVVPWNPLIPR